MAKINKVYPAFYNGVTQQNPELILDSQCKEMVNCVPNLVTGVTKRPPTKFKRVAKYSTNSWAETATVFHTYDRGEDNEEYIFVETQDTSTPVRVFNKEGLPMVVEYDAANEAEIKNYLNSGKLKGLTVQDRTWIFSKAVETQLDVNLTAPLEPLFDTTAYYWIKRGSGDRYNPFNYAVYLDGVTYSVDPNKPSNSSADPATGAEDSDVAAQLLTDKINAGTGFTATLIGSILQIVKTGGGDFEYSSWDSWGNQASEGWKGSVNKITDLPKDMPFSNVYVEIIGNEGDTLTNYFVKWNGSSWEECLDPKADRGKLVNMPVKLDRTSIVNGVATFTFNLVDWSLPKVGNLDNNPDPSFVGQKVQDLFFYKNRFGIASSDSVTLTESANYTNFYASTVTDIVDTDVIDITIASNQASKIYFVKPFNNSLYIFTKYSQYELVGEGVFSPSTVSLNNTTNYPMAINVEPVVMNDSLYFISTTDNQQQLREYIKTDTLSVKGVDLNVSTPTYLEEPISKLIVDGVLGYVLCCTKKDIVYLYNFKEDGTKRIQSSWSKWNLLDGLSYTTDSFEYNTLGSTVVVTYKTPTDYRYNQLQLDYNVHNDNIDTTSDGTTVSELLYSSSIVLPDYYPKLTEVRTPMNKVLIKKVTIEGEGSFDAEVYRKDYNTTFLKSHNFSLKDLDLHIASKVGNVLITIKDNTQNDFTISSIVLEAILNVTSKELK